MAAGDKYFFILRALCQGREIINKLIIHFDTGTATPAGWIAKFESVLKSPWLAVVCGDYTIQDYSMQQFTETDPRGHPLGPKLEFSPTGTVVGSGSGGGNLTGQGLIKLSPAVSGRGRRGRINVGPLSGSSQSEGLLSSGAFTNLSTLAQTINDQFTPTGVSFDVDYSIHVWSRRHLISSDLIAVTAERQIATQRRRGLRPVKTRR